MSFPDNFTPQVKIETFILIFFLITEITCAKKMLGIRNLLAFGLVIPIF